MLSKKSMKILSVIVLVVMLLVTLGNVVCAVTVPTPNEVTPNAEVSTALGNILGIMKWVGIAVAVVIAMYLGISYITKSPEGKADIKKQLPLFIGGIAIVLSASAIVGFIQTALGGK